jgi:hypothetical protein
MQQDFQRIGDKIDTLHSVLSPDENISDRGADFGDDDNACAAGDQRVFVKLPQVNSPVRVDIWNTRDYLLHQLGVDPGSKFCWVSRNYLERIGLRDHIRDIDEELKYEHCLVFGGIFRPSGVITLTWKLHSEDQNEARLWEKDSFYVFDNLAAEDFNLIANHWPRVTPAKDPTEARQRNGNSVSYIDYTLDEPEKVPVGSDYCGAPPTFVRQVAVGYGVYAPVETFDPPGHTSQNAAASAFQQDLPRPPRDDRCSDRYEDSWGARPQAEGSKRWENW